MTTKAHFAIFRFYYYRQSFF